MRSDVRKIARGVRKVYRAGKAVGRGLGKAWQGVGKLAVGIQSMSKAIRRKGKRAMAQLDQRQRAPHQPRGRSDVGAKSMSSLKRTIADAKAGSRPAQQALGQVNKTLLDRQAKTITREARTMDRPRDFIFIKGAAVK